MEKMSVLDNDTTVLASTTNFDSSLSSCDAPANPLNDSPVAMSKRRGAREDEPEMGKRCRACGALNGSEAVCCRVCGTRLADSTIEREHSRRVSGTAVTLILVVLAISIALLIAVAFFWHVHKPSNPVLESEVRLSSDLYYSVPDSSNVVTDPSSGVTFVNNELVLYASAGKSRSDVEAVVKRFEGVIVGQVGHTGSYQVRFNDAYDYQDILTLSEEIEAEEAIEAVTRNVAMELSVGSMTKDPAWSHDRRETWGLRAIKAPEAWDTVTANESVRVGIMDDQFYAEHEDLKGVFGEMMPSYDRSFNASGNLKMAGEGKHGTHVSGIIAARSNKDKGSVGVAHGCTLYGWSAIDKMVDKEGKPKATLSYGEEVGLVYLVAEKGCRVINMSIYEKDQLIKNSTNPDASIPEERRQLIEESKSNETAIRALVRAGYDGFVICKCTGNEGHDGGLAEYDYLGFITAEDVKSRIIMVGSVSAYNDDEKDYSGDKAALKYQERPISVSKFSNGGKRVDIVAPGGSIYSTYYNVKTSWSGDEAESTYDYLSGTSQATPMVSGVAALVIAANPSLKGDQIKQIICDTAAGSYDVGGSHSVGLVDAEAAVKKAKALTSDVETLLKSYVDGLGIHRYELDYLWQARRDGLRMVVGKGIEDGSPIGAHIADFDGDGVVELLVVRWHSTSIALEMYTAKDGDVALKAKMDGYASNFPLIMGIGCLDVACDASNGIDVQWWGSTSFYAGGHVWELDRYMYDGKQFVCAGKATQGGTDVSSELGELKGQLSAIGVQTDSIPDTDDGRFLSSMLADRDPSLKVITRIAAGTNAVFPTYETLNAIARQGSDQWSDESYLGGFVITQAPEVLNVGEPVSSQPAPQQDTQDSTVYTLRFNLGGLKSQGGNGDIGGGVYVPGTVAEYREYYGENGDVKKVGYVYVTHRAIVPGTGLTIEYWYGDNDEAEGEACSIKGTVGELVAGLPDERAVDVKVLARSLQSDAGAFDAGILIPELVLSRLEKCGVCYVSPQYESSGIASIYYADGNSTAVRELTIELGDDGMVSKDSPATITTNVGLLQ